ncbi:hypothetical protein D3C81_1053730 [compost metagenome]
MWVVFQPALGVANTYAIQTLNNLTACRVASHTAMQRQDFRQLLLYGMQGIE